MDSAQQDPMAVLEDGAGPVDIRGSKVLEIGRASCRERVSFLV